MDVCGLSTFSSDSASELDILGHDGDTLCVDGAQVGIFEKTYEISLASLLESHDCGALETQVGLEVLCDFTDQALEGEFPDEELSALLVTPDFSKGYGTGSVTMGFLHTSGRWGRFTGCLGRKLLPWCLSSGGLARRLFGSCHFI
jgi:histone H3